jgi:two-component system cell cycle response regulator DivK
MPYVVTPSSRTPAAFGPNEAPTLTRQPAGSGAHPLVLVIDDDPDMSLLYAECLAHLGYRTSLAASGEQGLEAALQTRPDAILMDVSMPGIGGLEATRRIKSDARTRRCLVVIVTANGASMFAAARAAGCDAYFCKPFNAFALDSVLRVPTTVHAPPPSSNRPVIVKRCGCGREYTRAGWLALPFRGWMNAPRGGMTIELRNCVCGSSIALPAPEGR